MKTLALIVSFPLVCGWWRPSGWLPVHNGDELILSTKECSRKFIEDSMNGVQAYRQECGQVGGAIYRNVSEKECLMQCYYFHSELPFDEYFLLPWRMDKEKYFLKGVGFSHDSKSTTCVCGGLVDTPTRAPSSSGCTKRVSIMPLTCMWVSKKECLESPSDSCTWTGSCCIDGYAAELRPKTEYMGAFLLGLSVFVITVTAVFAAWCVRSLRDMQHNRASRRPPNAPYGYNEQEPVDFTSVVMALTGVRSVGEPDNACCVVCLEAGSIPNDAPEIPEHSALEARCEVLYAGEITKFPVTGWVHLRTCSHILHRYCLEKWFIEQAKKKNAPSCPVCRTTVDLQHDGCLSPCMKTIQIKMEDNVLDVAIHPTDTQADIQEKVQQGLLSLPSTSSTSSSEVIKIAAEKRASMVPVEEDSDGSAEEEENQDSASPPSLLLSVHAREG